MQHKGLACRPAPVWVKAGQLVGPGVRPPFSPFPQQGRGFGLRHHSPRLKDEGGFGETGWNRVRWH